MDVGIVFAWVMFSILVAILAAKNGRSGILGFIIAMLLSPLFGFVLYLILGQSDRSRADRAIADEQMIAAIRAENPSDNPNSGGGGGTVIVMIGAALCVVLLVMYFVRVN